MNREEAINRVTGYLTDYLPIEDHEELEEIIKALKNPNPFELINTKLPCPLCVVRDRYGGAYSSARFLAFNLNPYSVQELPIDASDIDCENFWNGKDKDYDVNDYIIGKGETPEEAVWILILLLQDKVEKKQQYQKLS